MGAIKDMAMPILGLIGISLFLGIVWLLWTDRQNKVMTKGKLKAYILLENKTVWKGMCEYGDTKVRAPWNKGDQQNKDGERVQVFQVEGDQIWNDVWPEGGYFRQTVPASFFHERHICAIFPPEPCNCGHEDCQGMKIPELTPSQLGLMEDEHVTEVTMKATMWVKEMFDQIGSLMSKLLPSWVTIVGFIAVFLALAVLAFFVYRMSGEVSWLHGYLTPGGGSTTP